MSEVESIDLDGLYQLEDLIDTLYPRVPKDDLNLLWDRFTHTSPSLTFFKRRTIRHAIEQGDCSPIFAQFRASFFLDLDNEAIEKEIFLAMNQGIAALNSLFGMHFYDLGFDFLVDSFHEPFDLLEFLREGREQYLSARDRGDGSVDHELLLSAYEKARSYDLGYRILIINEEPRVLASVRNFQSHRNWFEVLLGFESEEEIREGLFSRSWMTNTGVRVYGDSAPMRSRVKVLHSDGRVKYDSLLMKLCLNEDLFEGIDDFTGVEFVVEDDLARRELVDFIAKRGKPGEKLVDYKDRTKKEVNNPMSSQKFSNVSFGLYIPTPLTSYGLGSNGRSYERNLVEVQILTLEEARISREDPNVTHSSYRGRQFRRVFPAWFPQQIYEPVIRVYYLNGCLTT